MYDGGAATVLLPRSVQQRVQLARALRHDGARNLGQTGGRVTHFVAGLGTSGTFVGTGRRLRELNDRNRARLGAARLAAARPRRTEAHGVGDRAGHLRSGAGRCRPARRHRRGVRDDAAAGAGRRTAGRHLERRQPRRRACKVARGKGAVMVVVFSDGGERYLSERFWENPPEGALDLRHELMAIALTAEVDAAIRAHGRETYPHECCGALIGTRRRGARSVRAAEHDRRRPAAAVSGAAGRLPRRREARARSGARAARVLSLASGSSGAAVAVRPRSRVAVVLLRDRVGDGGRRPAV